jgi:hypothetical protein
MEMNKILLEDRFRRSPAIVSRRIAGEAVLVPLRQHSSDLDNIYALNETAASAWELLDGAVRLQEILNHILEEYEIGPAQAEIDLLELMGRLLEIGAVEKV